MSDAPDNRERNRRRRVDIRTTVLTSALTGSEERAYLLAALAQAVGDSDEHPDGPMLSRAFWDRLETLGVVDEVRALTREIGRI